MQGPGLTEVHPIDKYLDGNFPSLTPSPVPYKAAFPNLTFDSPLTFVMHPTQNKIILGQRDGKIYWFNNQDQTTQKNLLIDLSNEVGVVWDGGFLGMALHPNFGETGSNYFYTFYTTRDVNGNNIPNGYTTQNCTNEEYWGNYIMLTRFEVADGTLDVVPNSKTTLFKIRMYGTTHRGGALVFGDDGFLYITTGDQTAFEKAQDIENNLDGGVLRIDVDKDPLKSHAPIRTMPDDHGFSDELSGNEYWIPNDNPFLSPSGDNFEEYYSIGHRSPHRMTKDPATGIMYIGEVGLNLHEEINVVSKGKNFGWPVYEGNAKVNRCGNTLYNNMAHEAPLVSFPRFDANAIIGGFVYRGSEIPDLAGKYICADYGTGEEIWSVDVSTGNYELLGNFAPANIISFGQDNLGEIYIMKLGVDNIYKLTQKNNVPQSIPQWLSQTGAFEDLANLTPADGVIPYDQIEPFWSDGALKKRWMVVPNDGSYNTAAEQIAYSENDVWIYPEGSVLIKHFELPLDANNPGLTKRLETRFSVKGSDGNFYFATYKWNAAQTDAELLASGLDEDINVLDENGVNQVQTWHYPSTSECLSCHNAASGGTLGPRTRNLNNSITYESTGIIANQLVTLSSLGTLDSQIDDNDTPNLLTISATDDSNATLDQRARSYLDVNCAYCHSPGTGNRANFDLRLINTLEETGLLTAGFSTSLGIEGEAILVPGDASKSHLYHRINSLDENIMMPPLAKNEVDEEGAALIAQWINQLNLFDPLVEGTYNIQNKGSGKVVEIAGANTADLANAEQVDYSQESHQQFEFTTGTPDHFTIKALHSDRLVDLETPTTNPGTNVLQRLANGTATQEWQAVPVDEEYFHIINKHNGHYLEVENGSLQNGANIVVNPADGSDAQLWKLNPAQLALATADVLSGDAPLTVNFTGSNSPNASGFSWDFGGDGNSTTADPQHTFTDPGVYDITLTVTGTNGTGIAKLQITVNQPLPNFELRINAGGPELTHNGELFEADQFFTGGKAYTNNSAEVAQLYKTERSAPLKEYSYDIPLANGQYNVSLHFAEIYWGATGGGPGGIGRRIFDVNLEGSLVLDDYDLNSEVGPQTEVIRTFPVTMTDGTLNISLDALGGDGIDQPKLSAIEIVGNTEPAPPVAVLNADITEGDAPLTVNFTGSNSTDTESYSWDFGGDGNSTEADPQHTFTDPGVYNVVLTVNGPLGTDTANIEITVDDPNAIPPVAVASSDIVSGDAPLTVNFTGSNSTNTDSYAWDFGGDGNSTEADPQYTFTDPGIYNVVLTVTGPHGTDSANIQITVSDPAADFELRINAGGPELTHNGELFEADQFFTGGKAYTNNNAEVAQLYKTERSAPLKEYSYDIPLANGQYNVSLHFAEIYWGATGGGPGGDGRRVFDVSLEGNLVLDDYDINSEVGPQTEVIRTFPVAMTDGTLNIGLDALGGDGIDQPKLSAIEIVGNIDPEAPIAIASADLVSGDAPLTVNFTGSNSTNVTSFSWDFGGDGNSTAADPQHTFNTPGVYNVVLTVTGASGTDTANLQITVTDPNAVFELRINSGGPELTHNGDLFEADQFFSGGRSYTNNSAEVASLYKTERSSPQKVFTYDIPLDNGQYNVSLHFAEIYWGATGGGPGGVGRRVFDVNLEGALVLDDYDINADVGPQTEVIKTYPVTISDGSLTITFDTSGTDGINQPKLSAIEIIGDSGSPSLSAQLANDPSSKLGNNTEFNLSPVPVRTGQRLTATLRTKVKAETSVIRIMSISGQVVQESTISTRPGINTFDISTELLPSGIYLVGVRVGSQNHLQKIIVY